MRKSVRSAEARNFPDGNIEDRSLRTLKVVLLILPGGPDISAPVELGTVGGMGEISDGRAAELSTDEGDDGQQEAGDDGDDGGGGEMVWSSHGQVWLH